MAGTTTKALTKSVSSPWVTVGVCGGVAAYKAAELVRALQQLGADVHVVMTRAAEEFVRPLTFSSLTGHRTIAGMWGGWGEQSSSPTGLDDEGTIQHISEAEGADALVIAPATAHMLAKMANGLADDFLSTMVLATTAPVIVAPAMNVNMWNHTATQANVAVLRSRGVTIVPPGSGYLACGMTGAGRLASIDSIAHAVMNTLADTTRKTVQDTVQDLVGETVLVTAGGTREAIDPVRFLGNRSSGKMGYALAEAARERGAEVILVSAPTALDPPEGCTFVPVTSAEQMHDAVMNNLAQATVVIGAAAVADFRMATASSEKLRRTGVLHLELQPTEDIIRAVAAAKPPGMLVVAFAAEMDADIKRAREKMQSKGADAIVLNDISRAGIGFDSERNAATFITERREAQIAEGTKRQVAEQILDKVLGLRVAATKR